MSKANERQVGGDHYKTGGTELWDLFGPGALAFYAARYVQRWRKKNGVQDLEKAVHVCERLREEIKTGTTEESGEDYLVLGPDLVDGWLRNSGMNWDERNVVEKLLRWTRAEDIDDAIAGIEHLIENAPLALNKNKTVTVEVNVPRGASRAEAKAPPRVLDKNGRALCIGDPCTYAEHTGKTYEVFVDELHYHDKATVRWGSGNEPAVEKQVVVGSSLRYDETREPTPKVKRQVPRFAEGGLVLGPVPGDERPIAETLTPTDEHRREQLQNRREAGILSSPAPLAPWVVDLAWLSENGIPNDVINRFWTKRGENYVLDPHVEPGNISDCVRRCYTGNEAIGWTVDINQCPKEARGYYPVLPERPNLVEWERLPEWQRQLYRLSGTDKKFELCGPYRAWYTEEEIHD